MYLRSNAPPAVSLSPWRPAPCSYCQTEPPLAVPWWPASLCHLGSEQPPESSASPSTPALTLHCVLLHSPGCQNKGGNVERNEGGRREERRERWSERGNVERKRRKEQGGEGGTEGRSKRKYDNDRSADKGRGQICHTERLGKYTNVHKVHSSACGQRQSGMILNFQRRLHNI